MAARVTLLKDVHLFPAAACHDPRFSPCGGFQPASSQLEVKTLADKTACGSKPTPSFAVCLYSVCVYTNI